MGRSRWLRMAISGLVVIASTAGGIVAMREWRFRSVFEQAGRAVAAHKLQEARDLLERLYAARPDRLDVAFELGACRQGLNDLDAALAIWKRIPAGSAFGERAALYREQIELARGRWSDVETTLTEALRHLGPLAPEVRSRLARLLRIQGRRDEVAALLEAGWDRATDRVALLREHAGLDLEPPPDVLIRSVLDDAAGKSPDDDRVRLGQANCATRAGRFDEAAAHLEVCLRRRPRDVSVRLAQLDWAEAAGRADAVRAALAQIPARQVSAPRIAELRAWLAARGADRQRECEALEAWRNAEPGAAEPLERLATLADQAGVHEWAVELRRRKAVLDRDRRLYRSLIGGSRPAERAAELAPLAESLSRRFEALGWWSIVLKDDPGHAGAKAGLARLEVNRVAPPPPSGTLADLLVGPEALPSRTPRAASNGAPPRFEDAAGAAGLSFTYDSGKTPIRQVPETMGGGVALLDYDGDGRLDVYCIQGGRFPPPETGSSSEFGGVPRSGDRLFRNRGDGTFEDISEAAGIAAFPRGYGHGVTTGDYDGDGRPDLFVTRWRSYALYRNRGDGTFEDVTTAAGLGGDRDWPTSAAFADFDNDGDLDLYVCHYLKWDASSPRPCRNPDTQAYIYCQPHILETLTDHIFRNDGGRFVDVSEEARITDREGPGLGVVTADLNDDGRVDIFVANDGTANYLFLNRGGFRFQEVALESGVASNAEGGFQSGMGVACGDLDGDGSPDLIVTNFYGEGTTFFRNMGGGQFADRSAATGILAVTRQRLGFGTAFLDFNNDGRLDIATANGHVNDFRPKYPYAMPAQLLSGSGAEGARLADVTSVAGPPWTAPHVGRGLAGGDIDNDGRVDVVMVPQDEPLLLARNRTMGGHFVTLLLEGGPSNRDGIGARITVVAGALRRISQRTGGGSYQSANDPRLHFGLAENERIDSVEVRWPSGRVDRFRDLAADRGYRLREGESRPIPLEGFSERP